MPNRLLYGLCAALALTATHAFADDAACLDGADRGQRLLEAHKLVEARDQFRACAASCSAALQSDCLWGLAAAEKALQSAVAAPVVAPDIAPKQATEKLQEDVKPSELPPAPPPQPPAASASAASPAASPAAAAPEGSSASVVNAPPPDQGLWHRIPWRTVGWVAVGTGASAFALGTAFGIVAISDHDNAHCNASHQCFTGPLNDAKSAATVSNVGLVVGTLLAAGGIGLVLFGPDRPGGARNAPPAVTAVLAPEWTPNGAGLGMGGTW